MGGNKTVRMQRLREVKKAQSRERKKHDVAESLWRTAHSAGVGERLLSAFSLFLNVSQGQLRPFGGIAN
jgi:hypothetical protein